MKFFLMLLMSAAAVMPRPLIFQPSEGVFRSEAPRQTEGWLGLYCKETCALRPSVLQYRVDSRDEDRMDVVTRPSDALLVFRDVPGLSAGPIVEAVDERAEDETLKHGSVIPLDLEGEKYELRVTAKDDYLEQAVLTLHHRGKAQEIFRMGEFFDDGHISLYFAGDLDRDGKLDLIMSNSPKYSYYPVTLFLSSAAGPGQLVREVTTWDRYSC